MNILKIQSIISVFIILFLVFSTFAYPRSVYVITDHEDSDISAYEITGDQISYQTQMEPPLDFGFGAVGLALDPCSSTLFTSYDDAYKIGIINAETLKTIKSINTPVEFAGLSYDIKNQRLLAAQRENNKLYAYLWNPINSTLVLDSETPKILTNLADPFAHGIIIDEVDRIIYVTDATNSVKYYDADDPNFGYLGSINITVGGNNRQAVGIDFYRDSQGNKYLYTGAWAHSTYHNYLVRTDITDMNNPSSDQHDVGAGVISVAVDQTTGYVYVTTSNNHIEVYSNATFPSAPCYADTNDISGPADIIVRGDVLYKSPAFYFEKVDVNEPNCVFPGDYITYKITYGPNGIDHNNVVITDYLPCQVDYINPSDPNYDSNSHTYKWQIGSLSASAPNDFVTLTVNVNLGVEPNGIITNYCEIESDHYLSFASADTSACFWYPYIIYVDVNAVGCGSGLSWYHADPNLQRALQKAQAWDVNQIWVAEGMYKPTTRSDTDARAISFELLDSVAVYGGFPTGGGTWAERNPSTYETILSGDIGTPIDQNDNSYHVVKCEDVNNAVLDGFTITAGNADAISSEEFEPNQWGGGIYCKDSNGLMITNCAFSGNLAIAAGGGMYNSDSSPTLINCAFNDNTVYSLLSTYGGGICNYQSSPTLINCKFSGNSATTSAPTVEYSSCGGAILNWYYSNPNVTNCTFSGNSATTTSAYTYGGAIFNWYYSNPNVTNCTFSNNSAYEGGAVYNYDHSDPNIINCVFNGNKADYYGGGMVNFQGSSPTIINCIFSGNSATPTWDWEDSYGGAIYNWDYSDPNISNCIFGGNTADYGGGMGNFYDSSPTVTNCIFSGNSADYGGGMENWQSSPTVTNCTFSGNLANYGGGMYNGTNSVPNVTNCILWTDKAGTSGDEIYNHQSEPNFSYCDIEGGLNGPKCGGQTSIGAFNIDADPCFFDVEEPNGSWTEDASYDSLTFQSTLTDAYANWSVNQLAGKFVSPNTPQLLQFFIVSNDVNTIKVWSDVESIAHYGDTYQIYDYHLELESVCIDEGDPEGDYTGQKDIDGEPRVFDGDANETDIVDMGADEYYWSPADFNSDGLVNFFDYALLADAWLTIPTNQYYNEICDLVDNNCIDSNDLARFCEDWLWQTAWAKAFPYAYGQSMVLGMGKSMGESLSLTGGLFPSASAEKTQPELTEADIEEIIKWLAELWLTDDELRKMMTEDEWLKFIEEVIQALKEQIYN